MIINTKDILKVYKTVGNLRQYNNCINYLKLKRVIKNEINIKEVSKKLKINYKTASHWIRNERVPYGIQLVNYLKNSKLLPFYTNDKLARIIGFIHGDGYIFEGLTGFGFASSDLEILKSIQIDIKELFNIKNEIKKFREIGEKVIINGKESKATKPTYHLEYRIKAICHILFLSGAPHGKKVYQSYSVPKWIKNGNLKIKKSFLHGLFDSELSNSTISSFGSHKDNIGSARMELGKCLELEEGLVEYMEEIRKLLSNFKIDSIVKNRREYNVGKVSYTLNISNKLKNIKRFLEKINFYYSKEKKEKGIKILNLIEKKKHLRNNKHRNLGI